MRIDATTLSGRQTGKANYTLAHTVGADLKSPILILCYTSVDSGGKVAINSATFNGVALTKATSVDSGDHYRAEIWYLVNPASGSHDLYIDTEDSVNELSLAIISLDEVDLDNPIVDTATDTDGTNPTISLDIVSEGSFCFDAIADQNDLTVGAGTQLFETTFSGESNARGGASYKEMSAIGSQSLSWTAVNGSYGHCAVALKPLSLPKVMFFT